MGTKEQYKWTKKKKIEKTHREETDGFQRSVGFVELGEQGVLIEKYKLVINVYFFFFFFFF